MTIECKHARRGLTIVYRPKAMLTCDARLTSTDYCVHVKGDAGSSCLKMTKRCAQGMADVCSLRTTFVERYERITTDICGQRIMSYGPCRFSFACVSFPKQRHYLMQPAFSNVDVA